MEIQKPNDILVATINNPNSSTYDLMSAGLTPDNTSLFPDKEVYKQSDYIKELFTQDGKFDDIAFNNAYSVASKHYEDMSNEAYLKSLSEVEYSPFDITRPAKSKTFKVNVDFEKEINPFRQTYSKIGINSIQDSDLSLREIAQQEKIFDPKTNTWSEKSANDLSLLGKLFGDTLVYAQWEEDGTHLDIASQRTVKHRKGDWKTNDNGNLYLEKLAGREIYGRQIVNPMDMLTTDGSFANQLDIFDSDSKEKSVGKVTLKIAADIAPFLIPYVAPVYGGIKAAIGLASVMPTFFKALDGILENDNSSGLANAFTAAEGYMAKFTTSSVSDKGQKSLFTYEQMGEMVGSIFSQIYEQRAMAGLSKYFGKATELKLAKKEQDLIKGINESIINDISLGKITIDQAKEVADIAKQKIPELASFLESRSKLSKSFSLGYMALTSTNQIYSEAIAGGYDRRTAGFAALAAAAGQYGIMMNNQMGSWFLDESTGYTSATNKRLLSKAVKEHLDEIQKGMGLIESNAAKGKASLGTTFRKIKDKMYDVFTNPADLKSAMVQNAFIEGMEEVTEQAVLDSTKGIIDTMSYLGLFNQKGSFGGFDTVFSKAGLENYLANFMGGVLGGALFEFNRQKIAPWVMNETLPEDTKKSMYQLIANGETDNIIKEINRQRSILGNNYISPKKIDGNVIAASPGQTQADLIADIAIQTVKNTDNIMNLYGTAISDKDIIQKAMIDHLVIKQLNEAKESNEFKIGIEGLVVDDFRNANQNLLKVDSDIGKLEESVKNNTITEKGSKELENLKELKKGYEKTISDIKEGKLAEDYFTEAVFYLSKNISENFLNIDKLTYTKTKYEKDYNDLEDTGLGITKESIDKEWQDYINSKDLRKSIKVATKAYLEIEKDINPSIAGFVESGYSEERKKTLKNSLDILGTNRLFDVSNSESKKRALISYISTAKEIETKTGKRVIPWDVVTTDIVDKVLENNLLSTNNGKKPIKAYLEEEVTINGETEKRIDIVKNILNLIASTLPAEQFSYDMLESRFNSEIAMYNYPIIEKIKELDSSKTPENQIEVEQEQNNLENQLLQVNLDKFVTSDLYNAEVNKLMPNLIAKQAELQINEENIKTINSLSSAQLNKDFKSYQNILEEYANSINKNVTELTDEEKIEALEQVTFQFGVFNKNDGSLSELLESSNPDKFSESEKIVDAFIHERDQLKEKVSEYNKFKSKKLEKIETPEIFEVQNYALDAIIKEIKSSKNLDKELFSEVEKAYLNIISSLKKDYLDNYEINSEDFLDLMKNAENLSQDLDTYALQMESMGDSDIILPKYLQNLIPEGEEAFEVAIHLAKMISDLKQNNKQYNKTLNKLTELKEILNNKDNFISNTIYDFLENFEIYLQGSERKNKNTIFSVLKTEELSLFNASEITNYLSEGLRDKHMEQAINIIKMLKSAIYAMQTTEVDLGDPIGFIKSRQAFVTRNKIKSDVTSLKTINSDIATLMILDLDRIQSKLSFLKELAKNNAGQIYNEQENTRAAVTDLMLNEFKNLNKKALQVRGNLVIPNLDEILTSNDTKERKQLAIEEAIFEHYKNATLEEKIEAIRELNKEYKYVNSLDYIYKTDNSDRISKDIKELNRNDFLLSLISNIVINSRDFNNRLLNILKTDFNKSPFFTQELAVKVAYASIVQPELFAVLSQENKYVDAQLTDYITYILGDGGTGKTSVVFKMLTLLLQNNNPNMNIWFSAPHIEQVSKLKNDTLEGVDVSKLQIDNALTKQQLFDKLGISTIIKELHNATSPLLTIDNDLVNINFDNISFDIPSDLPNLIFVDEVTHFDAVELAVINELIKRARVGSEGKPGINFRMIGAGDPTQNGSTYIHGRMYNIDWVSGTFTPQLGITVRTLNVQKRSNNDSLAAITKKAIANYERKEDTSKVLNIIGDGIILKSYLGKDAIDGDLLVNSNTIPENVLKTLYTIIQESPKTVIGILSQTGTLDSDIKEAFDKIGISEINYKVYTPDNIQGSEADYFIFNTNNVKGSNIVRSLRNLYTYMSRARHGTIVLNSDPNSKNTEFINVTNDDGSVIKLLKKSEDFRDIIPPLRSDLILANKETRIQSLKQLLDPNFNIVYDNFKFLEGEVVPDEGFNDNILKNIEEPDEKSEDEFLGKPEDNFNYRLHTFYNDLNLIYKINGDTTTITKNLDNEKYGLGLAIDWGNKTTIEIPTKDFLALSSEFVGLKFKIWNNWFSNKRFELVADNSILKKILLDEKYRVSSYKTELVIRKDKYFKQYNEPFAKQGDNIKEHLEEGDPYVNLFLKVERGSGDYIYIQLATFPKLKTVKSFYDKYVKEGSESYKKYKEFLETNETEFSIDPSKLLLKTSTRALKIEGQQIENTLESLAKIPGLRFYDGQTFTSEPTYKLFPSGDTEKKFEDFKSIYLKHTFGTPISEEKLKQMYFGWTKNDGTVTPGYKGKPYVIVSFTDNIEHAQIILLKSKTRTFEEIMETIKNPLGSKENPKNARELLLEKGWSDKKTRAHNIMGTLFSGSQALDMLINLAVEQPDLFNKFFVAGEEFLIQAEKSLNNTGKQRTQKQLEFVKDYLGWLAGKFSKDLLGHLSYSASGNDPLRIVLQIIRDSVAEYKKSGKTIDEKKLRKELMSAIKSNKSWHLKVWNIFSFKNYLDNIATHEGIVEDIQDYNENLRNTLDAMIKHMQTKSDNKVYFNVPIKPVKGAQDNIISYELSKTELDPKFLYTERVPEGFYLSIDLREKLTQQVLLQEDPLEEFIKALKNIKYNGQIIINPESTDTKDILLDKIERAKLVREILGMPKNTSNKGILITKSKQELEKIKLELTALEEIVKTDEEIIKEFENYADNFKDSGSFKYSFITSFVELLKTKNKNEEDESIYREILDKWEEVLEQLKSLPDAQASAMNLLGETDDFYFSFALSDKIVTELNITKPSLEDSIWNSGLFPNC